MNEEKDQAHDTYHHQQGTRRASYQKSQHVMIITVLEQGGKSLGLFFSDSCYNHFTPTSTLLSLMDYSHIDDGPEQEPGNTSILQRFIELFVRAAGMLLLVIGLVLGFMVLKEAWLLYNQPTNIERFVVAIEQGSNLDQILAPNSEPSNESTISESETLLRYGTIPEPPASKPKNGSFNEFRLAYFPAWFIAIVLLLLIGRLAIAAVKTGGELALYNVLSKKVIRSLIREIRH